MFFGFEIKSVLLKRRQCCTNLFLVSLFSILFTSFTLPLQNALEFLQIFPNPPAVVLTAVLKLHGSYKLFF
jgi:hypothetical protein